MSYIYIYDISRLRVNEDVRRKYRHRLRRVAVAPHATNPQNNMLFFIADCRFKSTHSHQTHLVAIWHP